jgi:recombination protein RecR
MYLLQDHKLRIKLLADALYEAEKAIVECGVCFNFDVTQPCSVCASRGASQTIAIVENISDLWAMERAGVYDGTYHVLGIGMSRMKTPEDFKLDILRARCIKNGISEIIIATNATLDGQSNAFFITDFFNDMDISISRLASGIPIGGELDYMDGGTLSAAIKLRTPFR